MPDGDGATDRDPDGAGRPACCLPSAAMTQPRRRSRRRGRRSARSPSISRSSSACRAGSRPGAAGRAETAGRMARKPRAALHRRSARSPARPLDRPGQRRSRPARRHRIRARLERRCPALDYYCGFYVRPDAGRPDLRRPRRVPRARRRRMRDRPASAAAPARAERGGIDGRLLDNGRRFAQARGREQRLATRAGAYSRTHP